MYTREHFSLPLPAMVDFVRAKSFGVLATHHAGTVYTSPLPVDLRGSEQSGLFVAGHVARANAMTAAFEAGAPATITVLGPDTYVPAEWFGTRSRIPTWLYCAVEISGRLEVSDAARTRADVTGLIDRLQKETVEGSTWSLDEMPAQLTEGYLKNIVGFRLYDLRLASCFRLNQRKDHSGRLAEVLAASDDAARQELARLVLRPPTARTE
ncbi:FMN-binding negative transcriptional regulator [Streptomyces sp. Ag109_G2-15]|uniref:FMN-binding negative transcriptional regulator n=1 Tax=Streptomyces sp. Ag109_G2-15 TaxID=1938850 RepID=UPI000BCAFB5D|nr:FMN-binding negative transcriptional regulator [Streptomyces sp. Ag109_G2-15]SOD85372.1 negative transcriptional regulator, PaiB family [Streptomyces sp. Ag109_G2-15]